MATDRSAEPDTYYLTDYYRKYPLVLVRLSQIRKEALRDLLSVSWRLARAGTGNEAGRLSQDQIKVACASQA